MSETKGLDLIGAGQVAKAIPKKAWERLTNTACKIIEETLAPVTATTGGLGRLISAKFDKLVDAEKILAANVFEKANQKIRDADVRPEVTPKPSIIVDTLEFTGLETNILLQELWSNLLVCELTTGQVHPEFPKILSRLSPNDAQLLAQIAEQDRKFDPIISAVLSSLITKLMDNVNPLIKAQLDQDSQPTFSHELLERNGLIREINNSWRLTQTGKEFIAIVNGQQLQKQKRKHT